MACIDCFSGDLHQGTPEGREDVIHGLPTYISEPRDGKPPKSIIVIVPDAVGWRFQNNRILADSYAKNTNSLVYLPEFMDGHAISPDLFPIMDRITGDGWMIGKIPAVLRAIAHFAPFLFFTRLSIAQPRVYKFFHDLRTNEGASLPIGTAGFCWGGKFSFLLASDSEKAANGKSLVDCSFTAHPSNLVIPNDAQNVSLPLSVAVGDVDVVMHLSQVQEVKGILEEKGKDKHEVNIIPGAKHGFAVRAPMNDEKAVQQGKEAETQAINWFKKHLTQK
ncbi:MAG: hypothetical protein LQ342_000215 [Letrouitia transgressa]|nr:MAG: hypothetical protein LQ342_000215 [Letrouitia transgressa]